MILYISDFDLRGSGYSNIAIPLCQHLTRSGYEVLAIGFGYTGQEHPHPFAITQLHGLEHVAPMIRNIRQSKEIEAVIVALDIPLQISILHQLNVPNEIPYIGIFPLEAGPLCQSWAVDILRMDARLVMSQFGKEELAAAGVPSTYIPIGVDTASWRVPSDEERQMLRRNLGAKDDTFVVLTVADNQERKNLSRSMEIFADFAKDNPHSQYWLVTRHHSPVGWKLEDYAMQLGIMDKVSIWDRGMPFKNLWGIFAAADCFLLTSKAEGLAMPVLEAMSMRLPVVGTDCTAIREHLSDGRGGLIKTDYDIVDPFGNGLRYFADRRQGKMWLDQIFADWQNGSIPSLDNAQSYVQARTWDKAGAVLLETLEKVKKPVMPNVAPAIILPQMEMA